MLVIPFYISFIIKCECEWVSGMNDPQPKTIKVKGNKFLGTDGIGNKWQILRDKEIIFFTKK